MIAVDEARRRILNCIGLCSAESISVSMAPDRILAADVVAKCELPRFDNSAMDGYAVHSSETFSASPSAEVRLRLRGESQAGISQSIAVEPGTTQRIFTGAMVPPGVDAVIRQEDVLVLNDEIIIKRPVVRGENIRKAGEEVKVGDVVLTSGQRVTVAACGLLASLGVGSVQVVKRKRVGLMVTGNEVAPEGARLLPGQIYDSNSATLVAALSKSHHDVVWKSHATDNPTELAEKLNEAFIHSDVLLVTGGVSVGNHDYVKDVARGAGVEEVLWKVQQKPGKPLYVGHRASDGKIIIGLPGNPASVLVCFYEYVLPALLAAQGCDSPGPISCKAIAKNGFRKSTGLTHFLKGSLDSDGGITILDGQGSHMMKTFSAANCLVVLDPLTEVVCAGDLVTVHILPD